MQTLVCLLVPLLMGFAFGLPLLCALRRRGAVTDQDWLLAPFVGCALIVIILQNAVYSDITIGMAAPWLWAMALISWGVLAWRYGARSLLNSFPKRPMLVGAMAFGVSALGVVTLGASAYLGRAHSDLHSYTVKAQFLADVPFSTGWGDAGNRPWMAEALQLKNDRIGADVLHSFASVSALAPARQLMCTTLLLSVPLMSLATILLLRRLGGDEMLSYVAGAVAGMLPGFGVIHSMGFISQALGQSFLLVALLMLHEAAAGPRRGTWAITVLLLVATSALYTEFVPLLAAMVIAAFVLGALQGSITWRTALMAMVVLPVCWLAAIPGFIPGIWHIIQRTAFPTAGGNPLRWISGNAVVGMFWFPDFLVLSESRLAMLPWALGLIFTAMAVWGWFWLLRSNAPGPVGDESIENAQRSHRLLKSACVALLMIPILSISSYERHPYQVYKLLLGFSPLLPFGFAFYWSRQSKWQAVQWEGAVLLLLVVAGSAALIGIRDASDAAPGKGEHTARHAAHHKHRLAVEEMLSQLSDEDVVLAGGPGVFFNGWFSYAARNNRVWLVNPIGNNGFAFGCTKPPVPGTRPMPAGQSFVDLDKLPDRVLVLSDGRQVEVTGNPKCLWKSGRFSLLELENPRENLHPTDAAWRTTIALGTEATVR